MKSIARKIDEIVEEEMKKPYDEVIVCQYVWGSYVTGELNKESDIDYAIVAEDKYVDKVRDVIDKKLDHNYKVYQDNGIEREVHFAVKKKEYYLHPEKFDAMVPDIKHPDNWGIGLASKTLFHRMVHTARSLEGKEIIEGLKSSTYWETIPEREGLGLAYISSRTAAQGKIEKSVLRLAYGAALINGMGPYATYKEIREAGEVILESNYGTFGRVLDGAYRYQIGDTDKKFDIESDESLRDEAIAYINLLTHDIKQKAVDLGILFDDNMRRNIRKHFVKTAPAIIENLEKNNFLIPLSGFYLSELVEVAKNNTRYKEYAKRMLERIKRTNTHVDICAELSMVLGNYDEAIVYADKSLEEYEDSSDKYLTFYTDPRSRLAEIIYVKGYSEAKSGNIDSGMKDLKKAFEIDPTNINILQALYELSEDSKLKDIYKSGLDFFDDDTIALKQLKWSYITSKEFSEPVVGYYMTRLEAYSEKCDDRIENIDKTLQQLETSKEQMPKETHKKRIDAMIKAKKNEKIIFEKMKKSSQGKIRYLEEYSNPYNAKKLFEIYLEEINDNLKSIRILEKMVKEMVSEVTYH
ncbi:MAG: nucleotidyltransferase domain-containing protein [Candidatus Aenigmarchaeota archaeon]|nr:nucleotidyltransferase domain-containing protein [Candidatus Aenigmarchaeota archaeon]